MGTNQKQKQKLQIEDGKLENVVEDHEKGEEEIIEVFIAFESSCAVRP